jgi:brefeldin A-inhibited guanine nucleotide-exchange protein
MKAPTPVGAKENEVTAEQLEIFTNRKQLFANGVKLFNTKPNKGVKFFIENKFVANDHQAIAKFLLTTPQLSKPAIGDFLGDGEPENIKIMHSFIDALNFADLDFVQALRLFLQSFRLPGEAQKIDRLMEKFADRYCDGNPTIFAKADTAYTLAFSVIMLNTDQHSTQIKHRMDLQAFIKNNRGINDEGDLPDEFLGAIFNEIHNNEIVMEDEGKVAKISMGWGAGDGNEQKRKEMYMKEVVTIEKKTNSQMSNSKKITPFKVATSKDLARPMFAKACWAAMAAFSLQFESSTSSTKTQTIIVDMCLKGLSGGIRLACRFDMVTQRQAYVTALTELTNLSNFNSITSKNIKAIMNLITVGHALAEDMHDSWILLMKSISRLEMMQEHILKSVEIDGRTSPDYSAAKPSNMLVEFCRELQSQNSLKVIDKIFTSSVNLTGQSIIHFFRAVCQISLYEVGLDPNGNKVSERPPRMYLLQKIFEIAYYNMNRIRFEWTLIWRILQPHFQIVACHPDQNVATFAVDTLRQLGMKILEREELVHFSSQHEFLKSFEWIIKHTDSYPTRELILSSISQMITAKAKSIRSGWKSIFQTLVKCAQTNSTMARDAFNVLKAVFNKQFETLVSANVFVDLVSCLAEFALIKGQGPEHDEQVMGSIQFLQSCTKSLMHRAEEETSADKSPELVRSLSPPSSLVMLTSPHAPMINNLPLQPYLVDGLVSEEHFYLSWFPILSAFSRVVSESDSILVRKHSVDVLFETFRTSGQLFGPLYWKAIHRNIIAPIFDDLSEASNIEANAAILIHGLRNLVELISIHFDNLIDGEEGYDFLQRSLDSMVEMMGKRDEKLASTGQICFSQFLLNNHDKLTCLKSLGWLIGRIEKAFAATLPWELVTCELEKGTTPDPDTTKSPLLDITLAAAKDAADSLGKPLALEQLNFEQTIIKCVTHLELVQTVNEFSLKVMETSQTAIISQMQQMERERLLQCVYNSYAMARSFNCNVPIRHAIYKKGWVPQLPNLVKQETVSLKTYLLMLFASLSAEEIDAVPLVDEICDLLERCCDFVRDISRHQRDLTSWSPTLSLVYKEIIKHSKNPALTPYIRQFYKYAIKLMACDMPQLKSVLQEFLTQISEDLFIPSPRTSVDRQE